MKYNHIMYLLGKFDRGEIDEEELSIELGDLLHFYTYAARF